MFRTAAARVGAASTGGSSTSALTDALAAHIGTTQAGLSGGRIAVTSEPVRHHDSAFFRWTMTDAGGATVMTGFDVVQLAADGRIARLTGFFDSDTGTAPR